MTHPKYTPEQQAIQWLCMAIDGITRGTLNTTPDYIRWAYDIVQDIKAEKAKEQKETA